MSATICYRPIPKKNYTIYTPAPSSFWESLEKAFNEHGMTKFIFNSTALETLRGMAAMISNDKENPYRDLIDAIDKYEVIELWKEY